MNLPENVIREDDKFIFNFTTGKIIRKLKNGNEKLGDTNREDGYKQIYINGELYQQHRILYEKFHNVELNDYLVIDHIDGDKKNNRIENLRLVTLRQNLQNGSKTTANKSGFKNICWNNYAEKWHIQISGKHYDYFIKMEDAIQKSDEVIQELNRNGNICCV